MPKLYAAFASKEVDQWEMHTVQPTPRPGQEVVPGIYRWEYVYEEREFFYLIEEYIDGVRLDDGYGNAWPTGSEKVEELLRDQLHKLRSVPAEDPTHFGRIGGRKFPKRFPMLQHPPAPAKDDFGPFDYKTFVDRFQHSALINYKMCSNSLRVEDKILFDNAKAILYDILRPDERQPILSHLDLQPRNIIIKGPVYNDNNRLVDLEEVVIIDWEFLCWTPNWIEPATLAMLFLDPDGEEPCRYLWKRVLPAMIHTSWPTTMWYAYGLITRVYQVFP